MAYKKYVLSAPLKRGGVVHPRGSVQSFEEGTQPRAATPYVEPVSAEPAPKASSAGAKK